MRSEFTVLDSNDVASLDEVYLGKLIKSLSYYSWLHYLSTWDFLEPLVTDVILLIGSSNDSDNYLTGNSLGNSVLFGNSFALLGK